MGLLELLIVIVVVCALAWAANYFLAQIPSVPGIVPTIIWGVAVLIILLVVARAFGLHDVRIPSLR